jgi:hypothetical protein
MAAIRGRVSHVLHPDGGGVGGACLPCSGERLIQPVEDALVAETARERLHV